MVRRVSFRQRAALLAHNECPVCIYLTIGLDRVSAAFSANVVRPCIERLATASGAAMSVRRECCWVVYNIARSGVTQPVDVYGVCRAVSGNRDHLTQMLDWGALEALVDLWRDATPDSKLRRVRLICSPDANPRTRVCVCVCVCVCVVLQPIANGINAFAERVPCKFVLRCQQHAGASVRLIIEESLTSDDDTIARASTLV